MTTRQAGETTRRSRRERGRGGKGLVAAAGIGALVLSTLGAAGFVGTSAAFGATGAVTGLVYKDFAGNGVFDGGNSAQSGIANDLPTAGVTVTAYDATGAQVGQTVTTDAAGSNYSIPLGSVADGTPLRIEFTNLPAGFSDSFASTETNTSVQFVLAGDEGVNFAMFSAEQFNPGDPGTAVSILSPGVPEHALYGVEPALVATPWSVPVNSGHFLDWGPNDPRFDDRVVYATFSEVGSVDGVAFSRADHGLYAAATYKRLSGLKDDRLGAIYRVPDAIHADGTLNTGAGAVSLWLDVETDLGVDIGTYLTNHERGLDATLSGHLLATDTDAFAQAGKVGIGGVTIDNAGRTLYFVNLHDEKVYGVDIATKTLIGSWSTPAAMDANQRPYGLNWIDGALYLGSTDTGESTPFEAMTDARNAYVARAAVAADGTPGTFETVLTVPLGYQKGNPLNNWLNGSDWLPTMPEFSAQYPQIIRWNTWTDEWTDGTDAVGFFRPAGSTADTVPFYNGTQTYPQPMVTSVTIDSQGYLTVAMRDRSTLQAGVQNYSSGVGPGDTPVPYADPAAPGAYALFGAVTSGDILLAAPNGDGTFTLESNGSAGSRNTGSTRTDPLGGPKDGTSRNGANPVGGEGPGGAEFYNDEMYLGLRSEASSIHRENSTGGVVTLPGVGQVAATAYDPWSFVYNQGLVWFDAETGSGARAYDQTGGHDEDITNLLDGRGSFGKAGGIHDIALLTRIAPVEIGNRVWLDADSNGRQDAGEPAINGVTVRLFAADASGNPVGSEIASQVTRSINGEPGSYLFASEDAVGSPFATSGFTRDGNYVVVFEGPATGAVDLQGPGSEKPEFTGLTWNKLALTTKNASGTSTLNDSNADQATGRAPVTVGGPGQNDHTIDAGYLILGVELTKGDAGYQGPVGGPIVNDANTMGDGATYEPGETRNITITAANNGSEPLVRVHLADQTWSGSVIQSLRFQVPGDTTFRDAVLDVVTGEWSFEWAETYLPVGDAQRQMWMPGDTITGVATLTLTPTVTELPHLNTSTVEGEGAYSGRVVGDTDPYNAYQGAIQVIKYDGERPDPQVKDVDGGWVVPTKPLANAFQDANTEGTAIKYPADEAQTVRWVVTNTGPTALTNLSLADTTLFGPAIGSDWTADLTAFGGPADFRFFEVDGTPRAWSGIFPSGASFFAEGTLTLPADTKHGDNVDVIARVIVPAVDVDGHPTREPSFHEDGSPVLGFKDNGDEYWVDDEDPFHAHTIQSPIRKGDSGYQGPVGGAIVNDADTMGTGVGYNPNETRNITITTTNTGTEPLINVVLTDQNITGGQIQGLKFQVPGSDTFVDAVRSGDTWTFQWDASFLPADDPGFRAWAPGEEILGVATLTVTQTAIPHKNEVSYVGEGQYSHTLVGETNPYHAFTGAIQLIKYDGEKADPAVKDADGNWITPAKPLVDPKQDANDTDNAVKYPVDTPQRVRWVVTNTSTTALTNLTLVDSTLDGPAIGADWTADLSAFGGPADYSFVTDGPWAGVFPAGASFFAEGTLTLPALETHADNVEVVARVIVPAVDDDGKPTTEPSFDEVGNPVLAFKEDGVTPFLVSDDDPFHAWTGIGPRVDIEKGDGADREIVHDADTMVDGEFYQPGETREIVFQVTNTGDEDLREVVLTEQTLSGDIVSAPTWTMPDGTVVTATLGDDGVFRARWEATFGTGTAVWHPGDVIYGTAELTVTLDAPPHVDRATVDAVGDISGKPVRDEDDYNAFTAAIQVIKYDGNKPDPAVTDLAGDWITPLKPMTDSLQDANTADKAVLYQAGATNKVRWVVTNTGTTWLTEISLFDVTDLGPAIGNDWTADLSAFGGPAAYNFVTEGTWHGLIPPGASFFAEGTLAVGAGELHGDTVIVVGVPVVPEVDENGVPTGNPSLDEDGNPVVVLDENGDPVLLTDSDPFHAKADLPVTGSGTLVGAITLTAAGLLLIGALLLLVRRRTRQHEA